jgi:hypothetical protein
MISDLHHAPPRPFSLRPWQAAATRTRLFEPTRTYWPFLSSIQPFKSRTVLIRGTGNGERGCAQGQDSSSLGGRQARQVKWKCVRVPRRRLSCPSARRKPKVYGGRGGSHEGRASGRRPRWQHWEQTRPSGEEPPSPRNRATRDSPRRRVRGRAGRRLRASTAIFRLTTARGGGREECASRA